MTYFLLNIMLALVWVFVTGQFTPANLAVGFVVGYVMLFLTRRVIGPTAYFHKLWQGISFFFFFLRELVEANIRVAIDVLTPRPRMQPRVIAVPLDARSNLEITLLANLVSLTPGTLSLDISSDRRTLYIHAMYARDEEAVRRQIKEGMERRVLALVRRTPRQEDSTLGENT
jgi:multicomponent Na+:H+ antiporter subunit E